MARRLDIELTSQRDDGTWTWRAAGAREPRGLLEPGILSENAHVGDVLRVEADFELEGIIVRSAVPLRTRTERTQRIEIVTPKPAPGVTTSLVERRERRGRPAAPRERRGERHSAPSEQRQAERDRRPARGGPRRDRPAREQTTDASRETRRPSNRPPRIVATTKHRDALFSSLLPEQIPIAEQLALGGLAAVRRALAAQEQAARASGQNFTNADAILALAEQLAPSVKEAVWLDRAETTAQHLETVSLRELRATVTSAAPKDEHGRELLASLREALDARVTKLRTSWEGSIAHALDENKVLQALRLSARPPEPSTRFPASLVVRLAEATSAALDASTPPERWLAVLEAAVESPVRRSVKPAGLPKDASPELRKSVALQAGRVPALAALLGLAMPPPPRALPSRPPARNRVRPSSPPKSADSPTPRVVDDASQREPRAPESKAPADEHVVVPTASSAAEASALAPEDPVADQPVGEVAGER